MAQQVGRAEVVIDVEPGVALEHLARLERERDQARAFARMCYSYVRGRLIEISTGRYWHDIPEYGWLEAEGQ